MDDISRRRGKGITCVHEKEGIRGDTREYLKVAVGKSFSDYKYLEDTGFISLSFINSIGLPFLRNFANTLLTKKGITYLYGGRAKEGRKLKDHLSNVSLLSPPFSINIKDTMNSQHLEGIYF